MPSARSVTAIALAARMVLTFAEPTAEVGGCDFEVEPLSAGYFWDPSCQQGLEGCNADGKNIECRFCGAGDYSVPCPPSSCHFPSDPFVPYYWEPTCKMGMLGCWADGIHAQCRFCGDRPFTGILCPEQLSAPPNGAKCTFLENEPTTPYYWDAGCKLGMLGCLADGIHEQCRFCGRDVFAEIPCPASEVCSFASEPTTPYFWDPQCTYGKLGCMADGLHAECRFCGKVPFEGVPCPGPIQPPTDQCTFPLGGEPSVGYFWDETCVSGKLGCWADGMHAECRFCGGDVFQEIQCPNATAQRASTGEGAVAERQYDAATVSRVFMRESSMRAVPKNASADMKAYSGEGDEMTWLSGAAPVVPSFYTMVFLTGLIAAGLPSAV